LGTPAVENGSHVDVQHTQDGGFIILGRTRSGPPGNGYDLYLVKTDEAGIPEWTRTYGGEGDEDGLSVYATTNPGGQPDGYILTGWTTSFGASGKDLYLVRVAGDGVKRWERTFGNGQPGAGDQIGRSVIQTEDGGFLIVGTSVPSGPASGRVYMVRTNSDGEVDPEDSSTWDMVLASDTEAHGFGVVKASITGNTVYIIAGSKRKQSPAVLNEILLMCIDAQSQLLWENTLGHSGAGAEARCIRVTQDSALIVAGLVYNSPFYDMCLAKVGLDGEPLWDPPLATISRGRTEWATSVAEAPDGGYIIAGSSTSIVKNQVNIYLAMTDEDGARICDRVYGGAGNDWGGGLGLTPDGAIYIAGVTESSAAGGGDVALILHNAQ
jgi:hypothetical protein